MPKAANQQQRFAAELVDQAHGNQGGDEVHCAQCHRLQQARTLAETCILEDVVRVVEDRVDACELAEARDRRRQKHRPQILALEQRFGVRHALNVNGVDDLLKLGIGAFPSQEWQ